MLSVLHLYPVLRPTAMIRAITALAHQPFEPHLARGAKEIRPALAALERIDDDALGPAREQTLKADLPKVQRQLAQVVVAFHEDVEGAAQSWTSLDSVAPRPAYHSSLRFSKANNDSKR